MKTQIGFYFTLRHTCLGQFPRHFLQFLFSYSLENQQGLFKIKNIGQYTIFFLVTISVKQLGQDVFCSKISQPTSKAATHLLFIDRKHLFRTVFTFNGFKNKCTRDIKKGTVIIREILILLNIISSQEPKKTTPSWRNCPTVLYCLFSGTFLSSACYQPLDLKQFAQHLTSVCSLKPSDKMALLFNTTLQLLHNVMQELCEWNSVQEQNNWQALKERKSVSLRDEKKTTMILLIVSPQFPQICVFLFGHKTNLLGSMFFFCCCKNTKHIPEKHELSL